MLTNKEFKKVLKKKNIESLLTEVEAKVLAGSYHATAYNALIEYLENPDWFSAREGQILLMLSLEVLMALR
jgi:hypothetical protein